VRVSREDHAGFARSPGCRERLASRLHSQTLVPADMYRAMRYAIGQPMPRGAIGAGIPATFS
jgi:hypothetical protein